MVGLTLKINEEPGVMVYTFNVGTWEAETGRSW